MPEYVVTFGQQYPREDHPLNLEGGPALADHNGYWTIVAADEDRAREVVVAIAGTLWSGLYDRRSIHYDLAGFYELGEVLRIVDAGRMDGRPVDQYVDRPADGSQTLVTVFADGTGEVAHRAYDADTWGPPTGVARR